MSRREKILAALVGLLLAVLGVWWMGSWVNDAFDSRSQRLQEKVAQRKRQETILKTAVDAHRSIQDYKTRSLPSNLELARAQYEAWLADLLAKAEIANPTFLCKRPPARKDDQPVIITWSVSGVGRLDQVTHLLYDYYSLDTLHRMSSLKLVAIPDSRNLQISFDSQVYVLAKTDPENKLDPSRESEWAKTHGPELIADIIDRNMLSPANKPPEIARVTDRTARVGETIQLRVQADDPNELDALRFSLVDPLPGAEIDENTGELRWRPETPGSYQLIARVQDDGIPSQSATRPINVSVVAAPPPPPPEPEKKRPTVDAAMFTYATGQVRVNGNRQIWLTVRTTGQTLKLNEGDSVKIGSVDGIVAKINERSFELKEGETTREIRRGQPLVARSQTDPD